MRILAALSLVFFSLACEALPGRAADLGPTVVQPGVFSYQAPSGWTVRDTPLSKYKVSTGTPRNGFAANINIVIEAYAKSLPDYVAANLTAIKGSSLFQNVKVLDQQPFTTSAGLEGTRVEIEDIFGKFNLRQTFYFFDGGSGNKLVITASCLVGDGAAEAPIFDGSMKTFTLE